MDERISDVTQVSDSNTSEWVGRPVQNVDTQEDVMRKDEDRTLADVADVNNRLYYYPFTGQSHSFAIHEATGKLLNPLTIINIFPPLKNLFILYDSFRYESIELRFTLSAPKSIIGAVFVGYYPWVPWFQTTSMIVELQRHMDSPQTIQRMLLAPECHLMPIADSTDVSFKIGWTFPTAFLSTQCIPPDDDILGPLGSPVCFIYTPYRKSISTSTGGDPQLRCFIKFNGLRFYGPCIGHGPGLAKPTSGFTKQSGIEVGMAVGAVAETVGTGYAMLSDIYDTQDGDFSPIHEEGYGYPSAMQPAYAGDTAAVGPPGNTPIFGVSELKETKKHKVYDFIKRPQLCRQLTISGTAATDTVLNANPVVQNQQIRGVYAPCTYLRYYAQGSQFWRGTLFFDFVILGHETIEISYDISVGYPNQGPSFYDAGESFVTMSGICSGTYTITVPCPNLNYADKISIFDNLLTDAVTYQPQKFASSIIAARFHIVATMLDLPPTVPILIFIRAGDDFYFYQPYAVGLNNVVDADTLKKKKLLKNIAGFKTSLGLSKQCGIPKSDRVFDNRTLSMPVKHDMMPMIHIEDFMECWSRALPFREYDSEDEPVPEMAIASWPCSWPLYGGSAAWTPNVNNSWYVTNDYISFFSWPFMYYNGSIAVKVLCKPGETNTWKYFSLRPAYLAIRQQCNNPYTYDPTELDFDSNFGNGTLVTPLSEQPVLEGTLPYRSPLFAQCVVPNMIEFGYGDIKTAVNEDNSSNTVNNNIILQQPLGDLQDALYRKKGTDYNLYVESLLPPYYLWGAKGFDWS